MLNPEEELQKNISRLYAKDPTLLNLSVFSTTSPENLAKLFEALKGNTTLIELNLNFASLTEDNIMILLGVLKDNTTLKILKLQGQPSFKKEDEAECPVNDFSAHSLRECRHLTYLDVSYNKNLTDAGVECFAQMPFLETLYVRECPKLTSRALSFFFNHEHLLDLKLEHLYMQVSREDHDKIERMMEKNRLIYRMNVLASRMIERFPECVWQLPKPLQELAIQYKQKKFATHADTRSLVYNLSKLKNYGNDVDLLAAMKWSQEYRALCEREAPSQFFTPVASAAGRSPSLDTSTRISPDIGEGLSPDVGPDI